VSGRRRLLALLGLLAASIVWAGMTAYDRAMSPWRGYEGDSAVVVIPQGAGSSQVAHLLRDAGVIRQTLPFRILARVNGVASRLQAGEYLFDRPLAPSEVLDRIVRGDVLLHRVTIPEGLTGSETIDRIARARIVRRSDLEESFRDASIVRDRDPNARDLEGYLFPDTYRFARGTQAHRILGDMVARFREVYDGTIAGRAASMGMTAREVVTLASLIEKETSIPEERPRVSAVFHNRLKIGMPLQCDPTVIYAFAAAGRGAGELKREDLSFASPYNTYLNPGLPPGPIASPGRDSLLAAVSPAPVKDLYFVADGTGGHRFSSSIEDHERAVARYRRIRKAGS